MSPPRNEFFYLHDIYFISIFFKVFYKKRGVVKNGQLFVIFFLFLYLTLHYDYRCSETGFTKEKSNFHPTAGILNSSNTAALSQNGWRAV